MISNRLCLVFILYFISVFQVTAQSKRGDKFYKRQRFKEAIPFFEKELINNANPDLQTKIKLAYAYRMTNKMVQAEVLYNEIVFSDKVFSKVYLFYAESLMSNGKYSEAKFWLEKYLQSEPDDERAAKLFASCDMVPLIQPYFTKTNTYPYEHNNRADDNSGIITQNNTLLFSSDRAVKSIFYDPKTTRRLIKIFKSSLNEDGTYNKPQRLAKSINSNRKNTAGIALTNQSSFGVFSRNSNTLSKNNEYNMQLFSCDLNSKFRPQNINPLPFCSKESNYMHPNFSFNGKYLIFASDKPGGEGGTDLYVVEYTEKGWGKPQNLGTTINTSAHEGYPFMDKNDNLYFSSKGHPGMGGFDLFVSIRNAQGDWQSPINLGPNVNSSHDDISFYLDDTLQKGVFSSSRNGGDDDLYWIDILEITEEEKILSSDKLVGHIIPKDKLLVKDDSF